MHARLLLLVFIMFALAACQTGSADTDGALSSVAGTEEVAKATPEDTQETDVEETTEVEAETEGEAEEKEAESEPEPKPEVAEAPKPAPKGDAIEASMAEIASVRKVKGERGAVEAIFACYRKARAKSASLEQAQICAAQDFAVSREIIAARPANATGTGDMALLVSKRHASRIGALLQFKGMGQAQFNTFGRYLHAVAEPAYKKARGA